VGKHGYGESTQAKTVEALRGKLVEAYVDGHLDHLEESPHAFGHPHGVNDWHFRRHLVPVVHMTSAHRVAGRYWHTEARHGDQRLC
jgi:hypothetical protein